MRIGPAGRTLHSRDRHCTSSRRRRSSNRALDGLDDRSARTQGHAGRRAVSRWRTSQAALATAWTRSFERPAFHAGIDFVAPAGIDVRATAAGRRVGGLERRLWPDGGDPRMQTASVTRYGHLSAILVAGGASGRGRNADRTRRARPAARPARTSTTRRGATARRSTPRHSSPPARRSGASARACNRSSAYRAQTGCSRAGRVRCAAPARPP